MKSLIFLFTVAAVAAQTTVTVTGPTTVAQGATATLSVAVAGTAGTNLSALQFTAVPPVGVSLGTPVITTAAGTLGKGVYSNPATGGFLSIGLTNATPAVASSNPFADGAIFTIPVTFTSTPLGSVSFPLTSLLGASVADAAVTIVSGTAYAITVSASHCDYNGDGVVNYQDALSVVLATLGLSTCSPTFAAGCTLSSSQAVVKAAQGGGCSL